MVLAHGGNLGDLATDSVSIALVGLGTDGIGNDGVATLYSTLTFDATAEGSTDLSFVENGFAISVSGNNANSLNFGSGTVNVINAVPEPTTAGLGMLVVGSLMMVRRRK